MRSSLRYLGFGLPLLVGCPDDTGEDGSNDEVGDGDGDPGTSSTTTTGEPVDPLDDGGADPPGEPDLEDTYLSPTTLGNGLVHDTRYLLGSNTDSVEIPTSLLEVGVPWELTAHETMLEVGFRPVQIHAEIEVTESGSNAFVDIDDDSIYISDDDSNYLYKVETYLFGSQFAEESKSNFGPASAGFRPISIDVVNAPGNLRPYYGFTVAWVYDDRDIDWVILTPRNKDDFEDDFGSLVTSGYRPISMSSRLRAGTSTTDFGAILVDDGMDPSHWTMTISRDVIDLAEAVEEAWDEGFYPFSGWTRNDSGATPEYNMLWALRPPPASPDGFAIAARYHMTAAEFAASGEDELHRENGMHLLSADRYVIQGQTRYAAIWAKYPPHMRWQGTAFDEMDQDYLARYKPFHDQVITIMDNIGTPREGEFFRPSATLHIFEEDDLVLNRAYTYAPAIYPDTELDAMFKLASVSKSLTAAAIVKEFDNQSIPLSTTFASAVGWTGTSYCGGSPPLFPSGFANITIDQMLQHQAGFVGEGINAYRDHSEIVAGLIGVSSPNADGELPIDTEELLYYLGESNALCEAMDPAWNSELVDEGKILSGMYSNLGYSLLGEVLSRTTSTPYADYIESELLDPLVLGIVPDPDHRYLLPGPTLASIRSYLINGDHPYRTTKTWSASPIFGTAPPPTLSQFGATLPVWRESADPDSYAPKFVERSHHAGDYSLGDALLPAGGWFGNGADLGEFLRDLAQTGTLMDIPVADQLWDPAITIPFYIFDCWEYGRGFYAHGNWIAMAGNGEGSMAIALHNWEQDFTVVLLTNVIGVPFGEFIDPILEDIGSTVFECVNSERFPEDECAVGVCN